MKKHSLVFCPTCGTLLDQPTGTDEHVQCHCCGNIVPAIEFESATIVTTSRAESFPHRPVLEALEEKNYMKDGATIQEKCPNCDHYEMVFHTAQLRSADEGQTVFYNCVKCGYKYSINS
jgi:DNA-directed RNA polymerase I subunit RPA12